jgi:hypothetical protein
VVYDRPNGVVRIYVNGIRTTAAAATLPLIAVNDINCWLGRSQWSGDPMFGGTIDEFRIYNGPLLDDDIAASFAAGPDAVAASAPRLGISRVGSNIEITWPESAVGYSLQTAEQVNGPYAPAAVTPTTNSGTVKAVVPVPASVTNAFYELKK